jgi:glycosyltransferase involved in cell wall biosynthesis
MIDPQRPDYASTPAADDRPDFAYAPADARREPLVTILTPFFNTGVVFHETARSVMRQSLQEWEWLIVNDASSDPEALATLSQYRNSDTRIRVIDLPVNGGPSRARNVGYAQARAPYVLQLDSDNLLEPTAAEKWWWYLLTHPGAAFVKGFTVGFGSQTYLWRRGFHTAADFLESNPVDATSLVRVDAHRRAGGYDETMRGGLEDWDFWLRCASAGEWGATVPEFLDWYRRRPTHHDRWSDWDGGVRQKAFVQRLRHAYGPLWQNGFPDVTDAPRLANAPLPLDGPGRNVLAKTTPRLLLMVPWMAVGGSDKFNLDAIEQLTRAGWQVTVVATRRDSTWLPQFARLTPDVFVMADFLPSGDFPRFLLYLLRSRQHDVVMVSHAELGYHLLPFLRAHAPSTTFVDYCHVVEEGWQNGGYPRLSVQYRNVLDLSIVSSRHLARWMRTEGADIGRVSVCYTGGRVGSEEEIRAARTSGRQELGVSDDQIVLLYPARLCAQKQPRVFAETMRILADEGLRLICIVAGDGPERAWLGAYLKRRRLTERVRLLGVVSPARMSVLMAAADICFLPSTHEGVALTLYEAMSAGTVFVGADVGGQREVVDESCGVLLPRLDDERREAAAYAVALSQLARDRSALRAYGEAARRRIAEQFSQVQMGKTLQEAFARACQLRVSHPRPSIHPDVGELMAARAIEHERLTGVAEALWTGHQPDGTMAGGGWRFWVFRQCSKLEPAYAWGLRRGWQWLPAARERIRSALAS